MCRKEAQKWAWRASPSRPFPEDAGKWQALDLLLLHPLLTQRPSLDLSFPQRGPQWAQRLGWEFCCLCLMTFDLPLSLPPTQLPAFPPSQALLVLLGPQVLVGPLGSRQL